MMRRWRNVLRQQMCVSHIMSIISTLYHDLNVPTEYLIGNTFAFGKEVSELIASCTSFLEIMCRCDRS
jgi:hypothetical protein